MCLGKNEVTEHVDLQENEEPMRIRESQLTPKQ